LSETEVRRLLDCASDLKEQAILMTFYATGLRLNELIHLQVQDIDSTKMQIRVRQGKGAKDRNVLLSPTLLDVLRRYYRCYRPTTWLFCSQTPEQPIDDRIVQRMVRRLSDKAGLHPPATAHALRHYAESWIMPSSRSEPPQLPESRGDPGFYPDLGSA